MTPLVSTVLALHRIFVADGHSYFGRHGQPAAPFAIREVGKVECVAGRGLRGDRFFDYKDNYKGQVSLFSREVLDEFCLAYPGAPANPAALRRNLLVSGAVLSGFIGQSFDLQGVRLEGVEECRPCHWMNEALGPGAEEWLRGRGGLRCRILSDGWLHTTP